MYNGLGELAEDVYPIPGTVAQANLATGELVLSLEGFSKWLPLGPGLAVLNLDLRLPDGRARALTYTTKRVERAPAAAAAAAGHVAPGQLLVRVFLDLSVPPTADWSDRPDMSDAEAIAAMGDLARGCQAPGTLAVLRGYSQNVLKPPCEQTPCEVLETLTEFVAAWGLHEDVPMDVDHCYNILQAGCLAEDGGVRLGPHASRDAIRSAAHVLYKLLADLEARGREFGILGDGTGQAMARTLNFQRTLQRVNLALGAAEALACLRESLSPEFDVTQPNCHGYTVVGRKDTSAKKLPKIEMTDHLLQYCAQQRLRHQGPTVFAEQCVPQAMDVRWRSAQCRVPGCAAVGPDVMYRAKDPSAVPANLTGPEGPVASLMCLEHAAAAIRAGVPVVNDVFLTGASWGADDVLRRTNTAKRPRWLVGTRQATCVTSTKTWVPKMARGGGLTLRPLTCGDVVVEALDQRQKNRAMWEKYISTSGARDSLERYLTDTRDNAFPSHEPLTVLFAFNNGMFSIEEQRFCPYGALPTAWASHGAINFVNEFFDPLWIVTPTEALGVPGYDDITRTQGYKPDTVAYLDAFVGRLFYPAKLYDHWQLAIVFLGTAGSGKSSIARAVALLLRDQNVGNLPSNCEEQWAVATLVGKVCVMCTEMKQDFRLPNSVLQCMIAGDPVTVHEKFRMPYDVSSWETQLMLVGNVMPTAWYVDEGSPMQRRAMVFHANIKPSTQDPSIQSRFFENLGPFLVRVTRRYRELAERVRASQEAGGKCHARDFMPEQVVAFNNAFKNETSTAAVFCDHLLNSFELGFRDDFGPGCVIDLTKDADLVEFFRFLKDARAASAANTPRFPNVDLPEAMALAVAAAEPGRRLTEEGLAAYALEKRVALKDLKNTYNMWWRESISLTGGAGGRAKTAPDFNNILREIGLPVCVDLDNAAGPGVKFVYGISVRSGGAAGAGAGMGAGMHSMSVGGAYE